MRCERGDCHPFFWLSLKVQTQMRQFLMVSSLTCLIQVAEKLVSSCLLPTTHILFQTVVELPLTSHSMNYCLHVADSCDDAREGMQKPLHFRREYSPNVISSSQSMAWFPCVAVHLGKVEGFWSIVLNSLWNNQVFETRKEVLSDQESSWSSGNCVTLTHWTWGYALLLDGHIIHIHQK